MALSVGARSLTVTFSRAPSGTHERQTVTPWSSTLQTGAGCGSVGGGGLRRTLKLGPLDGLRPASRSIKGRHVAHSGADSIVASGRGGTASDADIKKTLKELEASISGLEADFLQSLPQDLHVDLKDAGFTLSSGALGRECGEEVRAAVTQLGGALEASNSAQAADALKALPALVATLPDGGSERAALGRRLTAAGRKFRSMGAYGKGELAKIASAFAAAGETLSAGCLENVEAAKIDFSSRSFKFGTLQLEVTPSAAFAGAAISLVLGLLTLQLAAGISPPGGGSGDYSLTASLQGALSSLLYGFSTLATLSGAGLIALGAQLRSEGKK